MIERETNEKLTAVAISNRRSTRTLNKTFSCQYVQQHLL